jgi:hypothetical protein
MSKYEADQYGSVYFYEGKGRTGLHLGRVLPGETMLQAFRRIKANHAEIKKLEDAGYTPADFEAGRA